MNKFSLAPVEMARSFWRNRELIFALAKRDVIGRYRGSLLGLLWSFFNPVLMLGVYTFVFSVVFKLRWATAAGESKLEFALILFSGLMVFNLFSECLTRAPSLIVSNANYVKKVVFPLEIMPFVSLLAASFHAAISVLVWLLCYLLFVGVPTPIVGCVPLVLFPLMAFILGLSWFLSALGVYMRDISQFVGVCITVLMFLSPIFYPASALPDEFKTFFNLNPLSLPIEQVRNLLLEGRLPDVRTYVSQLGGALIIAWLGFAWFQKTRKGFADVI